MRYDGPNATLVNEVIDFFLSDRLLASVGGPEDRADVRILNDIHQVIAIGRDEIFPVDPGGGADEDFDYYWGDLLENLSAEMIYTSEWYEWKKQYRTEMEKLDWPFNHTTSDHFRGRVPDECLGHVAEEIWGDLHKCAENRAYNGKTTNFWEQLLGLYFEGLWPCGWEGRWPEPGRFVAWRRASL